MREWIFKGVVPLLAVLLGVAFQAQSQASWGPWLKVATATAGLLIVGCALVSLARTGLPGLREWRRTRSIEADIDHDVIAVTARVAEAMGRSFTLSAGSVLNSLCDGKICDAVMVNAWGAHLATLQGVLLNLGADIKSGRLLATSGLARVCELQRDYTRLCGGVADVVRRSDRTDVKRSWDGIADHANSLSTQLVQLTHKIQARRGEDLLCYFEPVPKS